MQRDSGALKRRFLGLLPIVHENFWRAKEPSCRRETAGDLRLARGGHAPRNIVSHKSGERFRVCAADFPEFPAVGLLRVSATVASDLQDRDIHEAAEVDLAGEGGDVVVGQPQNDLLGIAVLDDLSDRRGIAGRALCGGGGGGVK